MTKKLANHKNYVVRTAGYFARQRAVDAKSAVVAAFVKRAPRAPGLLTRVRGDDEPWSYISTAHVLKESGYIVKAAREDARHG